MVVGYIRLVAVEKNDFLIEENLKLRFLNFFLFIIVCLCIVIYTFNFNM